MTKIFLKGPQKRPCRIRIPEEIFTDPHLLVNRLTSGGLDQGWTAQVDVSNAVRDDRYVRHGGSVCAARRTQPRHQRYLRTKA
jgi:hypothetical protein